MGYVLCCLLLAFPVFAWALDPASQSQEPGIDFLYINANAGEAAGGHTALRLGSSLYHYQFFSDSAFLLVREPWDSFRFLYNDLHNRSISIASLSLESSVALQIKNHFTELLVAQQGFFDEFEALRLEEQLVQQTLNGTIEVFIQCLGFFNTAPSSVPRSTLVQSLIKSIGVEFLENLRVDSDNALQRAVQKLGQGERPGKGFQEILAWREALLVLTNGQTLKSNALIHPMEGERLLSRDERATLKRYGATQLHSIQKLLYSSRPDRGEALLLQIARYLAVQQSLNDGYLQSLDPFFKEVHTVVLTDKEMGSDQIKSLRKDFSRQVAIRRKLFFQEEKHPEIAYSFLETSRARAWELVQVSDELRRVRILAQVTLPTCTEAISLGIQQINTKNLQKIVKILGQELAAMQKKNEKLHGYNLVWRNCATELIRSLNTSFPDSESGRKALGGWLEPDSGLLFIPFLFYDLALSTYSLHSEQFLPARRLRGLERQYARENDLLVWLRESNTLSSTLYSSHGKDTPFLFFTDDALLLRPLLGFLNVGYAALYGVGGILKAPLDGGDAFNQAARGIFYSLPELAFGNIRKGSYSMGEGVEIH